MTWSSSFWVQGEKGAREEGDEASNFNKFPMSVAEGILQSAEGSESVTPTLDCQLVACTA
jgi:hypothetical protein